MEPLSRLLPPQINQGDPTMRRKFVLRLVRRILPVLLVSVLFALSASASEFVPVRKTTAVQPVENVIIPEGDLILAAGARHRIVAEIEPGNASDHGLNWASSNEFVAIVDLTGTVTGCHKGNAVITAKAADGSGAKTSVTVTVKEYDLVFTGRKPQIIDYKLAEDSTVSASAENGNVKTDVTAENKVEITPLRPGTDTVSVSVRGSRLSYSVYVADSFADYETAYTEIPDVSPNASNGSFRDIVYGTPYAEVKERLAEAYGQDAMTDDFGYDFRIRFRNPGTDPEGRGLKSLTLRFCYDLKEDGTVVSDEASACFYRAECLYSEETDEGLAEALRTELTDVYGTPDEKDHWIDRETGITLDDDNGVKVDYLWNPGFLKKQILAYQVKRYEARNGTIVNYCVYIPEERKEKLPVLIYFHGTRDTMERHNGIGELLKTGQIEPKGIVILPQAIRETEDADFHRQKYQDAVLELANVLAEEYGGDLNRLSVSGHSDGGVAAYQIVNRNPGIFAACAPISAIGNTDIGIRQTALWVFQGAKDTWVKPSVGLRVVLKCEKAGCNAMHYIYEDEGHGIHTMAYQDVFIDRNGDEITLIDWLMSQVLR